MAARVQPQSLRFLGVPTPSRLYKDADMLVNIQPRESKETTDGSRISFIRVWETIQGEGPFVGTPAMFLRLAGCNLQCPLCDTDYTTKPRNCTVEALVHHIRTSVSPRDHNKLVVITGGEPFRQNLSRLVNCLRYWNFWTQIETNGTYYPGDDFPYNQCTIVCSPKATIHPKLQGKIHSLKYVVQHGQVAEDGLPISAVGSPYKIGRPDINFYNSHYAAYANGSGRVYVQPLDEQDRIKNQLNMEAAVRSCLRHGYRLCLQVHKIAGLP